MPHNAPAASPARMPISQPGDRNGGVRCRVAEAASDKAGVRSDCKAIVRRDHGTVHKMALVAGQHHQQGIQIGW